LQHPLESSTANTLALKENGSKKQTAKPETKTNKDTKNLACSLEKNRKKESAVGSLETK
jgi:hypothetical protein